MTAIETICATIIFVVLIVGFIIIGIKLMKD